MRMAFLAGVIILFLVGCDDSNEFDGEYFCQYSKPINNRSLKNGVRFFPPEVEHARVVVRGNVFTVYGLNDGEYVSSAMKKAGDKEKEHLDEKEKRLTKDAMLNRRSDGIDTFSPRQGMLAFTGVSNGNKYGQQLSNCIKQ